MTPGIKRCEVCGAALPNEEGRLPAARCKSCEEGPAGRAARKRGATAAGTAFDAAKLVAVRKALETGKCYVIIQGLAGLRVVEALKAPLSSTFLYMTKQA